MELCRRSLDLENGAHRPPPAHVGTHAGHVGHEPMLPRVLLAESKGTDSEKGPRRRTGPFFENSGGDLLSQGVSPQVPSALAGLTAVFGMGTGVTPPPWPPEILLLLGTDRLAGERGAAVRPPLEHSIASTSKKSPSPRPISTGRLNTLPCLHLRPINVVI